MVRAKTRTRKGWMMDPETLATDFLARIYCEKYGVEYTGAARELFFLFDINEFRVFHNRYYQLVLGTCV